MIKKLKDVRIYGLIFTVISAVFIIVLSVSFFMEKRLQPYLYDSGLDSICAIFCAALYFGCMKQEGEGIKIFRNLIVLVSLCFALNESIYFTILAPERRTLCFALCLISKLLDLVLLSFFYWYIKIMLDFEGKLLKWSLRIAPFLIAFEVIVLLSNIFYPTTFMIDADGMYRTTAFAWLEGIYLLAATVVTLILIFRSRSPRNQKAAALTFVLFPLVEYVVFADEFANSAQYGMVLMSLIIMYCVIFNEKSKKLAATQVELDMATEIQTGMLPSAFPAFPNRSEFDLYASMDPAKEVGGDFYDFFMIDDDHLGMVIADVSGKGIPASLFMMSAKILINDHSTMGGTPADILERVNKRVCANNDSHMFVTVWLGILEISTGKLTSASAGHEYPMINTNGKFELLKDKHGLAIGAMDIARYRNTEVTLKKGDSIFVYTDGVAEATDANLQLFGTDRTLEALNAIPEGTPQEEVLTRVRAAVDAFVKEAPQFDDLTMLGLKYNGPAETATEE